MKPYLPPLITGITAAAAAHKWVLFPEFPDLATSISFGSAIASISTTMLGFMLAALAVLASINHTHLVKMMRQYGHYTDLIATMMLGGVLFLACAVSGFVVLFGVRVSGLLLVLIVGLHVASLTSLLDVGRKLWLVLSNLRPEA